MNISKIQAVLSLNSNTCDNQTHTQYVKYNFYNTNADTVSFSGNNHKAMLKTLNKRLEIELDRLRNSEKNAEEECADINSRIRLKQDIVEKMTEITEEYRAINEMLSVKSGRSSGNSEEIAMDFLETMNRLGADKGFNRISGYKDVKKFLKSKFIISSILKDKIRDDADVPNVLLFYGPTNTGKSTFAIALAEHSLSVPRIIDISKFSTPTGSNKAGIMDQIEDYAALSKKHYDKTKERSIIIINEAEYFLRSDDDVINRFINFTKDCAKKYKCTVFLTTNFPKRMDSRILKSSTTPYKVAINPMDKEDCYELIKNRLHMANKQLSDKEIKTLIGRLFKNPNERYSNGAIIFLFNLVWKRNPDARLEDYLRVLNSDNGEVEADITLKELKDYIALKKDFSKDTL